MAFRPHIIPGREVPKLRIVLVTNTYPPVMNGVAVSTQNLASGLTELGVDVYVYAPAPPGYDISSAEPFVRWYSSVLHRKTKYAIALPFQRRRRAGAGHRSQPFDLVHTQHHIHMGDWWLMYAKLHRIPLVTTVHTQDKMYAKHVPLPEDWTGVWLDSKVRAYCNRADLVTTPAEGSKLRLLGLGVTAPIKVIANPVNITPYQTADGNVVRMRLGCGAEDPLIGYVGRLSPEKNLEALMNAARELLPAFPALKIAIVGDGPCEAKLKEMASSIPCGERIHFAGRVEQSEVPMWDAAFDIFCSPSPSEVQPLSFTEAMAASSVLVVMGVPGGEEMVTDGVDGRLVPWKENWGEGRDLAKILAETLGDQPKLVQMKSRAAQSSLRYDKLTICRSWLEIYDETIRSQIRF